MFSPSIYDEGVSLRPRQTPGTLSPGVLLLYLHIFVLYVTVSVTPKYGEERRDAMKLRRMILMSLILGTILSFHDTLWPYAVISLPIAALFFVVALRTGEYYRWDSESER
jgi:hypothetical protein